MNEPQHNSGAELEGLTEKQIREELRQCFPPGPRWMGLTYQLERIVAKRRDRLIKVTLFVGVLTLIAAAISAWPVVR